MRRYSFDRPMRHITTFLKRAVGFFVLAKGIVQHSNVRGQLTNDVIGALNRRLLWLDSPEQRLVFYVGIRRLRKRDKDLKAVQVHGVKPAHDGLVTDKH